MAPSPESGRHVSAVATCIETRHLPVCSARDGEVEGGT
jgi:hypothetical protein